MKKTDEKLLEVLKEIYEHLCSLRDIPEVWKKDLGQKLSDLIEEVDK